MHTYDDIPPETVTLVCLAAGTAGAHKSPVCAASFPDSAAQTQCYFLVGHGPLS